MRIRLFPLNLIQRFVARLRDQRRIDCFSGDRKMYEKLFSPVRIGRVEIKNRVAMTPMGVNLAAPGGGVNDDIIAFYEARARGGVGLILSGICRVMDGTGAGEACQIAARDLGD